MIDRADDARGFEITRSGNRGDRGVWTTGGGRALDDVAESGGAWVPAQADDSIVNGSRESERHGRRWWSNRCRAHFRRNGTRAQRVFRSDDIIISLAGKDRQVVVGSLRGGGDRRVGSAAGERALDDITPGSGGSVPVELDQGRAAIRGNPAGGKQPGGLAGLGDRRGRHDGDRVVVTVLIVHRPAGGEAVDGGKGARKTSIGRDHIERLDGPCGDIQVEGRTC